MSARLAFVLPTLAGVGCGPSATEASIPSFQSAVAPIDDGAEYPSFAAFRDTLRGIVARRDTTALLGIVADAAQLSYDDAPAGPDGLRALWLDGETPADESLWAVLDRLLAAGSVEEDGAMTVPFVAGFWPDDLDPYRHVAVVGDSVVAWDTTGATVAHLFGVHILPLADTTDRTTWQVILPDGAEARVARTHGVSPVGYRATFWETEPDAWQLHVFVSGD